MLAEVKTMDNDLSIYYSFLLAFVIMMYNNHQRTLFLQLHLLRLPHQVDYATSHSGLEMTAR